MATAITSLFRRAPQEAAKDVVGPIPATTHTPALPERQWIMVARAFALIALVSITLNIGLGWAIVTMLPLKRVEPFLVTFLEKSNQIVRIEPIERTIAGVDAMTEVLVRGYVISRHSVIADDYEMARRWTAEGILALQSTKDEYDRFNQETLPTWDNIKARRITRAVEIISVSQSSYGFYQADFTLIESEGNIETRRDVFTASMRVGYLPQTVQSEMRLLNPLGFKVANYTVARRAQPSR